MSQEYDSMVIYRSFYEAVEDCDDETFAKVFRAILSYGLFGEEIDLEGLPKTIFRLIRPQIDANNRKKERGRENGAKGAKYGVLGGRPKKNPEETPKKPQENPKKPANVNVNANANANHHISRGKEISDEERKRLEERDRILEEDDYAARHEGAGEVYFEPKVKLGWVKKEEPGESYEMQNGIPKPPAMSNEDYKKMMDRLTAFKNRSAK